MIPPEPEVLDREGLKQWLLEAALPRDGDLLPYVGYSSSRIRRRFLVHEAALLSQLLLLETYTEEDAEHILQLYLDDKIRPVLCGVCGTQYCLGASNTRRPQYWKRFLPSALRTHRQPPNNWLICRACHRVEEAEKSTAKRLEGETVTP